jgi:conserved hypothetical integral membrane protein
MLILSTTFVICLLISNLIAGKVIQVFHLVLPAAVILFPLTYILGDVLTEVYGFERTRLIIWLGFAANIFAACIFVITIILPYPSFWNGQEAYKQVLGLTPRIVVASLTGYFVGEFANSVVLSRMKVLTRGRWLWTRTIGSTIIGEGLDTIIFITIAFFGSMTNAVLLSMILAQYIFKVSYEVIFTPITYLVVDWVKQKEEIDEYDDDVKYNPFSLGVRVSNRSKA